MGLTLVVGDIHGCLAELRELVALAGLSDDDLLIAVGDVVDRGPDSPGVLDYLARRPNTRVVMGNHERKHVLAPQGGPELSKAQLITHEQIGEDAYPGAVAQMASFERYIELPKAVVIHGYLEPGVALSEQEDTVLAGTMSGAGLLKPYGRPWYELYDGDRPVICGHQNYTNSSAPFIHRGLVFGLDTDCAKGKALTGLLLPEFRILSVAAHDNHWNRVSSAHPHLHRRRS